MRRKRFQHGCVREVKHGSRRVWIGKYYENGESRTRVLGHAPMTEGGAWAELQRTYLNPINEGAGYPQTRPSNFKEYVTGVFIPQRKEKWREDSTQRTTLERFENYLFPAFENRELRDLTREKLQQFLNERAASGLSKSVVDHLRWDLHAIFKMAAEDALVIGNPAGSLVTPKAAKRPETRTMTKEEYNLGLSVLDVRERLIYRLAGLVGMRQARSWRSGGDGYNGQRPRLLSGYTAAASATQRPTEAGEKRPFHPNLRAISRRGALCASAPVTTLWYFRPNGAPFCPVTISCGGTSRRTWPQ
jgi:hypothetical protein